MSMQITDEQRKTLTDMQEHWHKLTKLHGEVLYQQRVLTRQVEEIITALDELDKQRLAVSTQIQEAFGTTGSVNLTTGEFIPD